MITLIKNEVIKLIHRKKTLVTLIAFIALIVLIGFGLYTQSKQVERYNNPKVQREQLQANISDLNQRIKVVGISDSDKKMYEDNIASLQVQLDSLTNDPGVTNSDWKANLNTEIQSLEQNLNDTNMDVNQKGQINKQLQTDKYLLANNIKPIDESKFNSVNYIKLIFQLLGAVFLAVGLAIFSSDMVAGEYTPATAKFLLAQPVSRAKVLLSKYITAVISSILLICFVEIIAFVVVGLLSGFGNMNYPVVVGERFRYDLSHINQAGGHDIIAIANTAFIIPMYKFLLEAVLLQILFIIACVSFVFMLSTVVKSSMVAMSISIVTIIAVSILQNISNSTKIVTSYFFIIYGSVDAALAGDYASRLGVPYPTLSFIIIVLIAWTIISYLIAHYVFIKRDILI
ncbi:MAG TPA: ABC transporter permease subunit [Clostridiaceae bacterium]